LARGKVKSCGCLNAERIVQHGMAHTHVYRVWQAMRQRCENPNSPDFANYGGRGIRVCEEWKSFERFFADMGNRRKGYSLDRIDVNGPYRKENCRWATTWQQANNTRRNRVIELNGERRTLAQWAEWTGLGWDTIRTRLNYGWDTEKALTTPVGGAELYEYRRRKQTLAQWAAEYGMSHETLRARINKLGWTLSKALTEPVQTKRPKHTASSPP
jgi:hypothetical protein